MREAFCEMRNACYMNSKLKKKEVNYVPVLIISTYEIFIDNFLGSGTVYETKNKCICFEAEDCDLKRYRLENCY